MAYNEESDLAVCVPGMGQSMGISSEKVTDQDIQAMVDGELDADRAACVAQRIQESPLFQKRYEELNHQRNLLNLWWNAGNRTT